MTDPTRRIVLAVAAVLTGLVLLRRRPIRTPQRPGTWHPLEG